MCYNCGCGLPDDAMGVGTALIDGQSITNQTFQKLAEKWHMSADEAKELIYEFLQGNKKDKQKETFLRDIYEAAGESQGMSTEEAKEETKRLLQKVLHK